MNQKRAQVTIFVIIAIVIVAGIVLFFTFSDRLNFGVGRSSSEVVNYVEDCIEETTTNGIYLLGLQGGYYIVPEPKKSFGPFYIPVYYKNPNSLLLDKNIFEKELGNYLKENLKSCEEDIKEIESRGYSINFGEVKNVKINFYEKQIKVSVEWPITVSKEERTEQFKKFESETNFDFLGKYNLIQDFMNEQEAKPGEILLTRIAEIGAENDFVVEGQILEENNDVMYSLIFEKEVYNNRTYVFSFVSQYQ